jgi:hypothetical protein
MDIWQQLALLVLEVGALALASGELTDAWIRGSVFARTRRRLAWRRYRLGRLRRRTWGRSGLELVACGFCLGPHVALWLALVFLAPGWILGGSWHGLAAPVFVLAAARLAWLGNLALPEEYRF